MKKLLIAFVLASCLPGWASDSAPAEINGTVIEAGAGVAKVHIDSRRLPGAGDRVEFFFTIPGVDDRARVGSGEVTEINGEIVVVKLNPKTDVVKGNQAIVFSERQAAATPPVAAARPPSVPPAGDAPGVPREPRTSVPGDSAPAREPAEGGTAFIDDKPSTTPGRGDAPPVRAFSGQGDAPAANGPRALDRVEVMMFTGKIYQGTKAIARLTINLEATSATFLGAGLKIGDAEQRVLSNVDLKESGEMVTDGFPLSEAGENVYPDHPGSVCRATLHFDPKGKPEKGARRLFGTVKTDQGRTYTFDLRPFEPAAFPGEGRPAPPPAGGPAGRGFQGPGASPVGPN